MRAAEKGDAAEVAQRIAQGDDIYERKFLGEVEVNALDLAIDGGYEDIVRLLHHQGYSLAARTRSIRPCADPHPLPNVSHEGIGRQRVPAFSCPVRIDLRIAGDKGVSIDQR